MAFGMGYEKSLRRAVQQYAEERGGRVEMKPKSIVVHGPLGTKETSLQFLTMLCKRGAQDRWKTGIGTAFKDAIRPDHYASSARITFDKEQGSILALSDAELRARLRVGIFSTVEWADELATCAVRVSPKIEARVVLDGFYLRGLPRQARARLGGTDQQLFDFALGQTIPRQPAITAIHYGWLSEVPGHAWLVHPAAVFGEAPSMVVADKAGLVWTGADPERIEWRLVNLLDRCDGPMPNLIWLWDGRTFEEAGFLQPTIKSPDTPEYSLDLAPAWRQRLGIEAGGPIGVWRR